MHNIYNVIHNIYIYNVMHNIYIYIVTVYILAGYLNTGESSKKIEM